MVSGDGMSFKETKDFEEGKRRHEFEVMVRNKPSPGSEIQGLGGKKNSLLTAACPHGIGRSLRKWRVGSGRRQKNRRTKWEISLQEFRKDR